MKKWHHIQSLPTGKGTFSDFTDADIISAVQFDSTGEFLATGDKGGCIGVYQTANSSKSSKSVRDSSVNKRKAFQNFSPKIKKPVTSKYRFFAEFQSHEPEFDYLKSLEIEERINQIKWCKRGSNSLMLISTNDKTMKLWKITEKQTVEVARMNNVSARRNNSALSVDQIRIPKITRGERVVTASLRRKYANAHAYHINSISVCSNGMEFLSSDDLRINVWMLDDPQRTYNIVDIKPENMEDLTEVITSACYHPKDASIFLYTSSCGQVKQGDLRMSRNKESDFTSFVSQAENEKSFFSEIIASISDCKYSNDGNHIFSRDYMKLKIWDRRMSHKPLRNIPINTRLTDKLSDLYENDCIFDKFEFSTGRKLNFVTGSYDHEFHVYDSHGKLEQSLSANRESITSRRMSTGKTINFNTRRVMGERRNKNGEINYDQKVLHTAWHPTQDMIAVAAGTFTHLYCK